MPKSPPGMSILQVTLYLAPVRSVIVLPSEAGQRLLGVETGEEEVEVNQVYVLLLSEVDETSLELEAIETVDDVSEGTSWLDGIAVIELIAAALDGGHAG